MIADDFRALIKGSVLSEKAFARDVVGRGPRTVHRLLAGEPIPVSTVAWLVRMREVVTTDTAVTITVGCEGRAVASTTTRLDAVRAGEEALLSGATVGTHAEDRFAAAASRAADRAERAAHRRVTGTGTRGSVADQDDGGPITPRYPLQRPSRAGCVVSPDGGNQLVKSSRSDWLGVGSLWARIRPGGRFTLSRPGVVCRSALSMS